MSESASTPVAVTQKQGASGKNKGKSPKVNKSPNVADGVPSSRTAQDVPSGHATEPQSATPANVKILQEGDKQGKAKKDKAEASKKPEGSAQGAGGGEGEQKSKAQLKAERRALQEAQRAAKETKKNEGVKGPAGGASSQPAAKKDIPTDKSKAKPAESGQADKKVAKKKNVKDVAMKSETEDEMWVRREKEMLGKSLKIDNNILNLGFQYFHHNIVGANARCIAMLVQLREVISKYKTPAEKELCRDLEKSLLAPCITYINYCRPMSTTMGNAIKHLKYHISRVPTDWSDSKAIAHLQDVIDIFIQENIVKASEGVAYYANTKIVDGDVILLYAASSLICQVLKFAHKEGKKFRVIVVEGRPRSEGKTMLRFLVRCGIPCSYVYIGSATHAMAEATKVLLGAAAMFSIGDMHSRTGNSMIAALAQAYNIPVLVCCETYKFTDKVQLHNGDSNLHVSMCLSSRLSARGKALIDPGPHGKPSVLLQSINNREDSNISNSGNSSGGVGAMPNLLNLMYDVTRSQHITMLVTELGILPCTSVPVVLRRQEDLAAEV